MMNMLAIFGLGTPEIIAILVIVFLLFGAKKLPEFARGLGKSLGEFSPLTWRWRRRRTPKRRISKFLQFNGIMNRAGIFCPVHFS